MYRTIRHAAATGRGFVRTTISERGGLCCRVSLWILSPVYMRQEARDEAVISSV